jgi:hypothetical protein
MEDDAAARVRKRILEWCAREGHGSKKRLAEAVEAKNDDPTRKVIGQSWATGILNGRQKLRLSDLDAVADLLGEPPGSLVRKPDRNYHELTMAETRLLEYYRSMPEMVRGHWMAFLDYMFRFQQEALDNQGREQRARTSKARRRESKRSRLKKTS